MDNARSISRTYRAAIRLGEDYITLEETITLPLEASDEEVQQAVGLGWRIYQAQHEALEQQVRALREAHPLPTPVLVRDPDAPASDKQRGYIATLQDHLTWNNEQLASYAAEQAVDLVTMTKGQASGFIDELKKLADERVRYSTENRGRSNENLANQPASARQMQALQRIAEKQGLELESVIAQRFGVQSSELSNEQAGLLLSELQARQGRSQS
ncbi:MAG: hypothetical protein EI684_08805 [Candidatus Viridilinea halotolerans]|uniref:Uncharacterized protein n=1 Tax=Candidatus Viridilinea halotolerans TaxID=2491704 RepID=A0A426U1P1_9CHLR|nr:MAG: hypothetical protein EI684_08805 [Candidatus Viridilinea halotolerans]